MSFINIAILTLLVVLALVVLVKIKKRITDYFLFAIIFTIAAFIASVIWIHYSVNHNSFAFLNITSYLPFIPILFYGLVMISKDHNIQSRWWLLALPHVCFYLFIVGDIYAWNDYSIANIQSLFDEPPWQYQIFYVGLQIYMITILIRMTSKLRSYQLKIYDYYSNLEGVDLSWFKYFLWVYISAYTTSFLALISLNLGFIHKIETVFLFINISILLSLIWMIYHGLRRYNLANFQEVVNVPEKQKYASSSLSKDDAKQVFMKIEDLFENQGVFLNQELKVQDIAQRLQVTNHNISQALNEIAGKSFYEYVNCYRLKYFQKQLGDPSKKKYTILALGMESGFNSKASINRVFKKEVGVTPKEYQISVLG